MIESAWVRTGPTLASPATSWFTFRNLPIRPVGGASSTTASYTNSPRTLRQVASCTLPVSSTSRSSRRDRGDEVDHADRSSAFPALPRW